MILEIYKEVEKGGGVVWVGLQTTKKKFGKGKEVRKRVGVLVGKYPKE